MANKTKICVSLDPELVREVGSIPPRTMPMSRKVEQLLRAGLTIEKMWSKK